MIASPNLSLEDGLPAPRRGLAIAVVMIGVTMSVLDASITNVALPTIARELNADPAAAVWVINAYQLVTAMFIVGLAALGDMIGYRRVYMAGLAMFTLASLGCALSPSLPALVAARVVQGIGASAMMSIGPALNRIIFPSRMLGKAVGISALTVAASAAAGPTLGGLILAVADWPWLFAINLPLGIAALALGWRMLPVNETRNKRFDVPGAILAAGAMCCFVLGVDGLAKGYAAWVMDVLAAASTAAAAAFIGWQRVTPHPLLPLDIFRSARFSLAAATSLCSFIAQGLTFVTLPFLFQSGYGYSPFASGLLFTPWPLTIVFAAPLAGHLADRMSSRILSTAGLAVLAVGLGSMATLGSATSWPDIIWRASLCGLGFGFFQSPNNRELLGSVPRSMSGAASGVLALARTFGQSIGAALAAFVLAAPEAVGSGAAANGVSVARISDSLWLACIASLAALVLSALRTRGKRPAPARKE